MSELVEYYNKFNEERRLTSRHGQVEYITTMKYIHKYLEQLENPKILDIGAGTGRYCVPLANEGYDVSAIELVPYNLGILKAKKSAVKAFQGTALKLSRFEDDSFDMTFIFGPMYHLYTIEEKVQALKEAKRVTKKGGYIFVAYCMNEYSVITYGFKEKHIKECIAMQKLTEDFHTIAEPSDLFDYMRLEDIDQVNQGAKVNRIQIIAADGCANYMRPLLKEMDEETFEIFLQYHLSTCERMDLMGASAHTVDILQV